MKNRRTVITGLGILLVGLGIGTWGTVAPGSAEPGPGRPRDAQARPGPRPERPAGPPPGPAAPLPPPGEPAAEGPESTAPPEPAVKIEVTDKGISVFAVSVDAHEFFTELGWETGTRIIVDDTVDRKITTHLTNKTMEEIMASLASAYGISASQVDGFYIVSEGIPQNPSSYLLSDIAAIPTQYVRAMKAKGLLPLFLQEHVKVNPDQNAVILSGPPPVLQKFRQDIAQFDIPAAQIMLDILMVELTRQGREELESNLVWQNARAGMTSLSGTGTLALQGVAPLPQEFSLQLKALVENRQARVRANPRIATVSGQPASIFIGLVRFLEKPVQVGQDRWNQVNFVEAGVRLTITPFTGGGGEILVDMSEQFGEGSAKPGVEVSTLAPDPVTGLPNKSTRSASTVVRVRDGETVIIGGLLQNERRQRERKIPLLGDIPVLGTLFRSKNVEETQSELVIFITPRVLSQTGHLPAEEEAELKRRFLGEASAAKKAAGTVPPEEVQEQ
jgi:type II secretory pathway component GspD/PulD (secretin)